MTLRLSGNEFVSLSDAKDADRNILALAKRHGATHRVAQDLWDIRRTIEKIAAGHLNLDPSACRIQSVGNWFIGAFHICVGLRITGHDGAASRKVFRHPLKHKVGGQHTPATVDEQQRSEVATYAWVEANCPEIPTPRLHGFGFSTGSQFTHCGAEVGFARNEGLVEFDRAYMLLDFVESGTVLQKSLAQYRTTDSARMQNLLQGLSRIVLALANKPQPRIGSLYFNDDATVTLINRPLFAAHPLLEIEGIPRTVGRTYEDSESFFHDMLRFREEVFLHQPNSAHDEDDCRLQMSHLALLRENMPRLVDVEYDGPFVLQFTDWNASNIFVDDEWNIVACIDLGFVCALPPDMLHAPNWLTVDAIDDIAKDLDTFMKTQHAFIETFARHEAATQRDCPTRLAPAMKRALAMGSRWFYECLTVYNGLSFLVEDLIYQHLGLEFTVAEEREWARDMAPKFSDDWEDVVRRKLEDKARYVLELERYLAIRLVTIA